MTFLPFVFKLRNVETVLLQADTAGAVERAAALLRAGELVALPTETVYGLAADAANPRAVAAVFQAKDRPFFDPLIVHLPGADWLEKLARVPASQQKAVEALTAAFWPGPLTILLSRNLKTVPDLVTAGSPLVALRVSAHPVFRAVVEALGRPLAAPSANRFGRISPTTGRHAFTELQGRIPLVLEAGATTHGLESTIVALEEGEGLRVLRHGPVTAERLREFGEVREGGGTGAARSAPGQVTGHYAPRTPLVLVEPAKTPGVTGGRDVRTGLLGFRRDRRVVVGTFERSEFLSEAGDLREAAARLFAALRRLDEAGLQRIVAERVPEEGLGRAIMERLRRAAAGSGEASGS